MKAEDINSIESESGIIATLIHHPEFLYCSDNLFPNHFSSVENRCVFTAITELVSKEIFTIDPYNIIEVLNNSDATRKLSEDISVENLQELIDNSDILERHTVEEYKLLVDNVLRAAMRRDLFSALKEAQSLCVRDDDSDIQQKVYTLIDDVMTEFSNAEDIPQIGEVVDSLWEDIEKHQDGQENGIPFKFPTLNEYVTVEQDELVILAAPQKGAKSMFMLNCAVDILRQGKNVMYIDSELSSRMFLCRLISHLTGIEYKNVKSGRYSEEENRRIHEALEWIRQQPLVHSYMPIFDQQSLYTAVKKIAHRFGKLDVLIVDYLKPSGDTDAYATYAELGKLTDLIKNNIAGKMHIAALAAAQLTSGGKLADSAKIARNGSTIIHMLDKTPEEIETDGIECGNKKLIVKFNRNGMQHAEGEYIDVFFNGNTISLEEAKQHIPVSPY